MGRLASYGPENDGKPLGDAPRAKERASWGLRIEYGVLLALTLFFLAMTIKGWIGF